MRFCVPHRRGGDAIAACVGETLAKPRAHQVLSIGLWENQLDADRFPSTLYPQMLELLREEIDGTPHVRTFSAVTSSVDK
jgi:hypothetical protein